MEQSSIRKHKTVRDCVCVLGGGGGGGAWEGGLQTHLSIKVGLSEFHPGVTHYLLHRQKQHDTYLKINKTS